MSVLLHSSVVADTGLPCQRGRPLPLLMPFKKDRSRPRAMTSQVMSMVGSIYTRNSDVPRG